VRIFSAGSALTYETAQNVKDVLGLIPTEIFGSTETGVIATRQFDKPDKGDWHPLEDVSITCDDMGILSVMSSYTSPEWIQTSDLVSKNGNTFTFLGRADSIVKIEGKRVSLLEIETALKSVGLAEDAVAVLLSTEKLAALVVLNDNGRNELSVRGKFRLGRYLRESLFAQGLPFSALPKIWRFADAIPTKETGKRDRQSIMAILEGDA
jgi:acyl-coenzyme A synthetase/AMP-(fatty) acid ligase